MKTVIYHALEPEHVGKMPDLQKALPRTGSWSMWLWK